jgi:site-specific DNA recombinase
MHTDRNTIAREYLRVSVDKSGRERSPEEQHDDNQRVAEEHGWALGEAYRDVGSASRYARNGRDGYDTLVADLEAGRFEADVLVIWESSRGSRRVGEWVTLIELCEEHRVRIHVTTHARTYDPANPRDRRSLLEDAVDSEYESGKLSERAKRAAAANAADGRPTGKIPYGYRRRYDERTKRLIAQEPEPAEAAIVRELYDRVRRGHSMKAIARDFDARGVRTRSGKAFSPPYLRDLAVRRTYVGERVHHGQVYPGHWPGIVDRATWHAVHDMLTSRTHTSPRPGRAVHLLSMIAVCDPCGGPLAATDRGGRRRYQCHRKGCIKVDYDDLTELAEQAMLTYLSRRDNVERLTADQGVDVELQQVRDEIAGIRGEQRDLARQVGAGTLSPALAAMAEPGILKRLKAAEERERKLSTPNVLRGLISPGADVARRWKAAPMSARREVARILLALGVLGELRVLRSPTPGRKAPIVDRVTWRTS